MVLGPIQVFTKENVKARWMERYTSDAVNKKFLGIPRGVYLGFVPSPSGLTLTLKPDTALLLANVVGGAFSIGASISGNTSLATADIRVVTQGYVLIDNVVGTFLTGETVTSGPVTATLSQFIAEAISFARVVTNTPLVPGRSEDMVDVITGDPISLNFTGFSNGSYYVILTASYQVGQATSATLITRTTPAPSGPTEVLVCVVTKVGALLTVAAVAPASRHEPFAFDGTRIGFMPSGSYESLLIAAASALEVIASRRLMDGSTAPAFVVGSPQTTGLPARLNTDLANVAMGRRLGKQGVTVRGNDFTLSAPATSANVSGSFAARTRDFEPYRDQSPATGIAIPAGVTTAIEAEATDFVDLVLTGVTGTFTVGLLITGATSGKTAIVKAISGSTISVGDFIGSLFVGEIVNQSSPSASGTVGSINLREGAVTGLSGAPVTSPNIVTIIDTTSGNRPLDAGLLVFGRLVYGPGGAGNPGEHGLSAGQQLNFAAGSSTVVVAAGTITTPGEISVGDVIEGADGRFYEVATITGSPITSLTLPVAKPYVGPTAVNSGNRRRRKFTLEFKKVVAGVETTATLASGTYKCFFPGWFTLEKSNFDAAQSINAPGGDALPEATSSVRGVAFNADQTTTPPVGPTPVIGAVRRFQNASVDLTTNFHTLNFAAGGASAVNGIVTIPAVSGPSGGSGPTGPTGPAGPGFSTLAPFQFSASLGPGAGPSPPFSAPFTFGFTIKMYMFTVTTLNLSASGAFDNGYLIDTVTPAPTTLTVSGHFITSTSPNELVIQIGATAAG